MEVLGDGFEKRAGKADILIGNFGEPEVGDASLEGLHTSA